MRIGNLSDRLVLFVDDGAVDVEQASDGRFESDPQQVFGRWAEFVEWATTATLPRGLPIRAERARRPRAPAAATIRLRAELSLARHRDRLGHARRTGGLHQVRLLDHWPIRRNNPSPGQRRLGGRARRRHRQGWQLDAADQAWDHIAGATIGQDVSERVSQLAGVAPQFSLGKSFPGFAPMGPWLVTPDELPQPDDLALGCSVNGEKMQDSRTSLLMFDVPALVHRLTSTLELFAGDVIFTGTPAGVGQGRTPPRFLAAGDELVTYIEGIGEMRHRLVEA